MSNLPDPVETNLLDSFLHTANSANWSAPTALYVGLCSAAPTDSATNECASSNNYARQAITFGTASSGQATGPTGTVTFPSASGSWGTISGYIICSSTSGSTGNLYLAYGAVSPTVAVTTNDTVSFAANSISLSFA